MPMSWEEFQGFLMNSQPFRIRSMIYQLNQKGANLPMLGPQREKVQKLIERFKRISTDQQREIFPEYFRDRMNINNFTSRDRVGTGTLGDRPNIGRGNRHDNTRTNFLRTTNVSNPRTGVQLNQETNSRPARPPRLAIHMNSQPTELTVRNQPQTPNQENQRLPTFFNSPLRLNEAPSAPPERGTAYQLTPRPQRRASITSPAPESSSDLPSSRRRRSMSVSAGPKGASVAAASAKDGCGEMASIECKICMDKTVECAIMPCGHACACYSCARYMYFTMAKCPICRGTIAEVIRIYW